MLCEDIVFYSPALSVSFLETEHKELKQTLSNLFISGFKLIPRSTRMSRSGLAVRPTDFSLSCKTLQEIGQRNQKPNKQQESQHQGNGCHHQLLQFDQQLPHLRCHKRCRHHHSHLHWELPRSSPPCLLWRRRIRWGWQRRGARCQSPPSMLIPIIVCELVGEVEFTNRSSGLVPNLVGRKL